MTPRRVNLRLMADVESLLHKAIPRLRKGDPKAAKLRGKLIKLATRLWSKGPRRLQKLGVVVGDDDWEFVHPEGDPETFLEQAHEVLGDKGFVRLFRAVKAELAERVAKKKESARQEVVAAPPPKSGSGEGALHFSDVGEVDGGSGELSIPDDDELSIPDDSGIGLALPPDEPMVAIEPPGAQVEEFSLDDEPLQIRFDDGPPGGAAPAQDAEDASAAAAADRALTRYRRSGDKEELKQALKLYKQAYKEADGPFPQGVARGGLALATLYAGDRAKAKEHAEGALKRFPQEPVAISVLCRVGRKGEKTRLRLEVAMRRAENALIDRDLREVREAAKDLDKLRPEGPEGPLAELAIALLMGRAEIEDLLTAACQRFPGPAENGDLDLGKAWETPLIKGCLDYVARRRDADEEDALRSAIEEADGNPVRGAIEIALGCARRALATRDRVSKHEKQELLLQIGRAQFYAQHYDAAKEILAGARRVDRNGNSVLDINRLEQQCGVMRRAFDKPGVKAKRGQLDGAGLTRYREALSARLELVLAQREREAGDTEETMRALVEAITGDAKRRAKIEKAAKKHDLDDPFARLGMVEQQMASLEQSSSEPEPEPEAAGGGFFGKMKAGLNKAAAKAKSAAKGAELAVRRSMAAGKRKEALIAVGQALRDRPERGWGDKELDVFLTKTDAVAARLEFLDEEADALRKRVAAAGEL